MYSRILVELIKKSKAEYGNEILVETKNRKYKGILMPPSEMGDSNSLIIKLDNGYNIGLTYDKTMKISKAGKVSKENKKEYKAELGKSGSKAKLHFDKSKPDISIVTSGGTITSCVDYDTGGVTSLMKPDELLSLVPEITEIVNISSIETPFTRMSESIDPKDWQELASTVHKQLKKNEGVILTHGTDTLHYTAAALSFMLRDLSKPVIITGSQRSSDRGSTDAAMNILCSSILAKSNIAEVGICMHATSNDDFCHFLKGTKVRKLHTSTRNAFKAVNTLPIAEVYPDGKINTLIDYRKKSDSETKLDNKYDEKVALIKVYPGMTHEIIDYYIDNNYKGLILEAFGLGQVPLETRDKKNSLISSIKNAIKNGLFVGFAPQTIYGSLDPYVYSEARIMMEAGVTHLKDMLPETALVKLGWVLGHTQNIEEVRKQMLTNIAGEYNERLSKESLLY